MGTLFHALGNDTRRNILGRLTKGDLTVGQLAAPLNMSLAAASKYVAVLERGRLLRRTASGRQHVCHLEADPLAAA